MDENRISDELVYLQTDLLTVTIKGVASHPAFSGVEFLEKESSVCISCDDFYEISLSGGADTLSFQNMGRATLGSYRVRPLFFEQQRYEIVIEPEEGHKVEFWHENYNIRKNITTVGRKSNMLSGVISFGNDIGMSDLIILIDGKMYLKLTIEVFPSKIGYRDDYKAIVADVTAEVYNLVFDFLKKTYDSFDISSGRQSSPVEFFAIIRKIYEEFLTAADRVIARPHHVLETEHAILPNYKIKRIDNTTLRWLEKHPDRTMRSCDQVLADRALSVKKYVTYDTRENRLTKYILQSTVKRLENFRKQYLKLSRDADFIMVDKIDSIDNKHSTAIQYRFSKRCGISTGKVRNVAGIWYGTGLSGSVSLLFAAATWSGCNRQRIQYFCEGFGGSL